MQPKVSQEVFLKRKLQAAKQALHMANAKRRRRERGATMVEKLTLQGGRASPNLDGGRFAPERPEQQAKVFTKFEGSTCGRFVIY